MLCILTSFSVLNTPESWSKHFFAIFNLCCSFQMFFCYFSAEVKKKTFFQSCSNFSILAFPSRQENWCKVKHKNIFLMLHHNAGWVIFQPVFRVCSTQTLIKICNSCWILFLVISGMDSYVQQLIVCTAISVLTLLLKLICRATLQS